MKRLMYRRLHSRTGRKVATKHECRYGRVTCVNTAVNFSGYIYVIFCAIQGDRLQESDLSIPRLVLASIIYYKIFCQKCNTIFQDFYKTLHKSLSSKNLKVKNFIKILEYHTTPYTYLLLQGRTCPPSFIRCLLIM